MEVEDAIGKVGSISLSPGQCFHGACPGPVHGDFVGNRQVQANAPGFSTYTVQKVTLDVDQMVSVNMKLAVATAGETVQVESTASQIEAQTITVGQVIDKATVQELPLNGRHFLDLTVLTPGGVVADTAGNREDLRLLLAGEIQIRVPGPGNGVVPHGAEAGVDSRCGG